MEIYILDNLYRNSLVFDEHTSFIWTERFSARGDFELIAPSTLETRKLFPVGTRIAIKQSYRVMTAETIEDTVDEEGKAILKVTGRSLEAILENRLARSALSDLTTTPKWTITDQPADIVRKLFHDICITGVLNAGDILDVNESSIFTADTIEEPSDTVIYEIDLMTLYQAMKDISDMFNMGFRIVRHPTTHELHFDVYMGSDRTTQQVDLAAVVFSPRMENLKNTKELTTSALYKNVAYVISPVGHEVVYSDDVDSSVAGFDRHALFVKADDITDGVPATATAKMIQRGMEELARNRRISGFDGELTPRSKYKYGTHYNLGDLVEYQGPSGATTILQVTEQIFVSDIEGDRSYPTLSINKFITPGSIDDWAPDEFIDDVDPGLVIDDA